MGFSFFTWWCGKTLTTYVYDPTSFSFGKCVEASIIITSPLDFVIILTSMQLVWQSYLRKTNDTPRKTFKLSWNNCLLGSFSFYRIAFGLSLLIKQLSINLLQPFELYNSFQIFFQGVFTALLLLCTYGEHSRIKLGSILLLEFVLQFIFRATHSTDNFAYELYWVTFGLQSAFLFGSEAIRLMNLDPFTHGFLHKDAAERATVISKLFFSWVWRLLHYGYRNKKIEAGDLHSLLPQDNLDKLCRNFDESDPSHDKCGIYLFISTLSSISTPLILHLLLDAVASSDPSRMVLVIALFFSMSVKSVTEHQMWMIGVRCGMQMRIVLIQKIYEKYFRLSHKTRNQYHHGLLQNLVAIDASKLCDQCIIPVLHWGTWSALLSVLICLSAISSLISIKGCMVWLSITLLYIPIGAYISRRVRLLSLAVQEERDSRGDMILKTLKCLSLLRVHGWNYWANTEVENVRKSEISFLRQKKLWNGLNTISGSAMQVLAPMTCLVFCAYILDNKNLLTPATVFSSLAWFDVCATPLSRVPGLLAKLSDAWASINRINKFFQAPEAVGIPLCDVSPRGEVTFGPTNIRWELSGPILFEAKLHAKAHDCIVLSGTNQSGKSSLLHAILGNIRYSPQRSPTIYNQKRTIPIAYCAQTPWIFRGTVRENILFGLPYDDFKYREVLRASALAKDVGGFPSGDLTQVGEKGKMLSGGQCQRISLARAAYSTCKLVILDDIFSSLDGNVRDYILEHCIFEYLSSRTRILTVNSRAPWCLKASQELCIRDKRLILLTEKKKIYNLKGVVSGSVVKSTPKTYLASKKINESSDIDSKNPILGYGSVRRVIFSKYAKVFGPSNFYRMLLVLSFVLSPVLNVLSTQYLSTWSQHIEERHSLHFASYFVLLSILQCIVDGIRVIAFIFGSITASSNLHIRLLYAVLGTASMPFLDRIENGFLMSIFLTDMTAVDEVVPSVVSQFFFNASKLGSSLGAILLSSPKPFAITAIVVVLSLPYAALYQYYRWPARELKRLDSQSRVPILCLLEETVNGIDTIKAYGEDHVRFYKRKMMKRIELSSQAFWLSWTANQWITTWLELIGNLLVLVCGIVFVSIQGSSAIAGSLGVALLFASRIPPQVGWTIKNLATTEVECIALERVFGLCSKAKESQHRPSSDLKYIADTATPGAISLQNVYLMYNNRGQNNSWVLKDLCIDIQSRSKVAIIGRTGAGKSSIFKAMMGYPFEGKIEIHSPTIGFIPQAPVLFGRTLREGLAGPKIVPERRIWEVLDILDMCKTVNALPNEIDCSLNIIEAKCSISDIQLFCIARALLRSDAIVLCDEVSSSLDEGKECLVHKVLTSQLRDSTILSISHSIKITAIYDFVLEMSDGKTLGLIPAPEFNAESA